MIDNGASGDKFLVGTSFSLADAVFFPSLAWLVKYGLDLGHPEWQHLQRYYENVKTRPSVVASWPPTWQMKGPISDLRMFDDIVPTLAQAQVIVNNVSVDSNGK